ncbi:PQQ-like beta-propeller repeat protein [Candidatus Poribacteria bacterium]|nr:PQQ-like beta-propeller repeat protein [Candidatus Poribacteria bacterium]MYB00576.1 PQQ-like beta-propeller repeat protein [Candidatus Poribacteria bacterium]
MNRILLFSLLCLFFVLPISIATADMSVTWVRTGVVIETEHKEGISDKISVARVFDGTTHELAKVPTIQQLDTHRILLQFTWQPNQDYQFHLNDHLITATAPLKPVSYLIRTVELDALLSLMESLRQPAKPTAVALGHGGAPNTEKLAVATDSGHLAVLQPITGETLWKTRISEGYVRRMAFSSDGSLLYVGEQAADGLIYCYDLTAEKPILRWKYRTADDIETSTPSNPDSVYAWVNYPGPACMRTLANGDLLVASVHSWKENDIPLKKSQLYRFDSETGNVIWKWPHDSATSKIIRWFDVSADGKTLGLVTDSGHNLQGSPTDENGVGNGKLVVLNTADGIEKWHADIEPLREYFAQVTFWRGVSISPSGKFINLTTDDGRAFIFDVNKSEPIWQENLTTPLEVSGIPIVATSGTIGATDAAALFVTGDTYIPYHLRKGAQKPSAGHPNGMTLFAYSWSGEKIWQWQLENMPQGLRIDEKDRYAALSVSKRTQDPNESLHGVSVFDLTAEGGGLSKYLYTYRTEGQLPYDTLAISADGAFIVVVEVPITLPDETVRGKNRVHVLY